MTKSILSAFGAFVSACCAIVMGCAFFATAEPLTAIMCVVFCFGVIAAIGWGAEGTSIEQFFVELFSKEGGDDE